MSNLNMDSISAALRRLEMSAGEQAIYLSLLRAGRATARMLADRTGLTRPSVYDQLKKLTALNLVVELDVDGKAYFAAGDIKHLDALLSDRIDRLEQSRQFLLEALPTLEKGLDTVVPKIRFFEGEDGLKQLLKDVMWHDHLTMTVCWNDMEMNAIYDTAFLRWWNERRQLRKLAIAWQVPVSLPGKMIAKPSLYNDELDTIKATLPTTPLVTRIIYGSKVACISSRKEAFGFIVESSEFSALQSMTTSDGDTDTRRTKKRT